MRDRSPRPRPVTGAGRRIRIAWVLGAALVLSAAPPASAAVLTGASDDGVWYYEIGGARANSPPANPRMTPVRIGGSLDLRLGYSCGKFDPVAAVTHILDDIKRGVDQIFETMVLAAKAAIASLPAYILQRANPGLYDLFQSARVKAEELVNLTTKTCEQMEAEIAQGKDPYRAWAVLAKGNDWKVLMGTEPDVVYAKRQVEHNDGRNGLPWIGGKHGGENQEPIRVIADPVVAGYHLTLNRDPTGGGGGNSGGDAPRLTEVWPTPEQARDWVVGVVGDHLITTCADCPRDTVPGAGLLPRIEEERAHVAEHLDRLVKGELELTLTHLDPVAAPGLGLSPRVIEVLRQVTAPDRPLLVGRLANEIATARVVEKGLLARRLLLTGQRVPEVRAQGPAVEELQTAVRELEREIETLQFERRVRQDLVGDTVTLLLRRQAELETRAYPQPRLPVPETAILRGGAVPTAPKTP